MDAVTASDVVTPLGTYTAGLRVDVLRITADAVAVVCFDLDHHPAGVCHTASVPTAELLDPEDVVEPEADPEADPEPEPVAVGTTPACVGHEPEIWFAADGRSTVASPEAWAPAAAICATCPVTAACLAAAMDAEGQNGAANRHGMWGGLTPDERAALAKTQARTGA